MYWMTTLLFFILPSLLILAIDFYVGREALYSNEPGKKLFFHLYHSTDRPSDPSTSHVFDLVRTLDRTHSIRPRIAEDHEFCFPSDGTALIE